MKNGWEENSTQNPSKNSKTLADEKGIDVSSEDGQGYHSTVVEAPLFKESIEIGKFKAKKKEGKIKELEAQLALHGHQRMLI